MYAGQQDRRSWAHVSEPAVTESWPLTIVGVLVPEGFFILIVRGNGYSSGSSSSLQCCQYHTGQPW